MAKRVTMAVALLAAACASVGCPLLNLMVDPEMTVPAKYDVEGKRVLILPMAEGEDGTFFDSDLGYNLAGLLAVSLRNQMAAQDEEVTVLPVDDVAARVKSGVVKHDEFVFMGEQTDADVVMAGRILEYRLKEPRIQGKLGTIKIAMDVYDVDKGAIVYSDTFTHRYPVQGELGTPELDPYMSEEIFRERFMNYASRVIAWRFFDLRIMRTKYHYWQSQAQR